MAAHGQILLALDTPWPEVLELRLASDRRGAREWTSLLIVLVQAVAVTRARRV
jgi:hypothetical protein